MIRGRTRFGRYTHSSPCYFLYPNELTNELTALAVDASKNWRESVRSLVVHTRARLDSTHESARSLDVSMIALGVLESGIGSFLIRISVLAECPNTPIATLTPFWG